MSYTLNESKYNSPNYTPSSAVAATYGMPRTIKGVTIHHWGVDGQNIDGISSYLCRPGGNTSAHFALQDGLVYCLVSPEHAAWHAGSAEGNATTIGIECHPEMTDGDLRTLVEFIQWLESVYGPLDIYRHMDWSSTACPGRYADKIDWIVEQVNGGGTSPAGPSASSGNMEAAIQWMRDREGQVTYSMDYRMGPYSYDCSSSVYFALTAGGFLPEGSMGNTETLFGDLESRGWTQLSVVDGEYKTQRGDVFIWGTRGASSGAFGHTGIFIDADNIINCQYTRNSIVVDNNDQLWNDALQPAVTIYRPPFGATTKTATAALSKGLSLTSKEYDDIMRELRIIKEDTKITRGGIFGAFSYSGKPGTEERGVVQLLKAIDRNTWNSKKMIRVLFDQFKVGIPGVLGDGDFGPLLRKAYGRWVRNAKGKEEWVTGYPEAEAGKARKDWWDKITKNTYDF